MAEGVGARGPCMVQAFRDPELGLRVTDVNIRFGGGYPSHMYGALPGRTYPELIVRMARGERIEPHVGQMRAGITFARYYWQIELDGAAGQLQPAARSPPVAHLRQGRLAPELELTPVNTLLADPPAVATPEQPPTDSGAPPPGSAPGAFVRALPHRSRPAQTAARQWAVGRIGACNVALVRPAASTRARPSWRSAATVLVVTGILVLGAGAAAYAALSKEAPIGPAR